MIESQFGADTIIVSRSELTERIRESFRKIDPKLADNKDFWDALLSGHVWQEFPSEVRVQTECLATMVHGIPEWKTAELHLRQALAVMKTYDPFM